ncbi:3532_t:CDS:1, partial [Funneliformis geosporum]
TNCAFEDSQLLSNALANFEEANWKENIRNYELGLRSRGSFYVNLTRVECLEQHQICDNWLSSMIRIFIFVYKSSMIYIISWWNGDGKEYNVINKDD